MKTAKWNCVLKGGPHDGNTLSDLVSDLVIPKYRETNARDQQDRVIFQFDPEFDPIIPEFIKKRIREAQ